MRTFTAMIVVLAVCQFMALSAEAYVYYVEAEDFDVDMSTPVVGAAMWKVSEDNDDASGERHVVYTGPHVNAVTSLVYPLAPGDEQGPVYTVWVRSIMPDGGSDSYFFYISNDGGDTWGPQQTAHGNVTIEWQWQSWNLLTPLEKGADNALRISERENAQADLISVRDDGQTPNLDEYEEWKEAADARNLGVEPSGKLTTTWMAIKAGR